MSRRKHLLQSLTQEIEPPSEGQHIVRAVGSRGSNIIEVEFPGGRATLCLLPARFHKKLWIKKGTYLIIQEETEADAQSSRVTGEITAVLYADHVKQLRKMPGIWPPEFEARSSSWPVSASEAAEQLASLGLAESDSEVEASGGSRNGTAAGMGSAAAAEQQGQPTAAGGGDGGQQTSAAAGAAGSAAAGQAAGAAAGEEEAYSSSADDLPPIPRFQNRKYIEYEVSDSESD